ncbi:MAG: ATPase, T2SS/T4P/T4SS family [Desulfosarcinaceae bacterium]|nr:ATPase, T2SS/T4P/T4SS family [Desulfosarcinaceae bacterium]
MTTKRIQKKTAPRIGELLVREGFLQQQDLRRSLAVQRKEAEAAALPLGEMMVQRGLISQEQLQTLLNHPDLRRHIGTLLVDEGLLKPKELIAALKEKTPGIPIGRVLVRKKLITKEVLEEFLRQQAEGIKIGELAFRLNMITRRKLDQLLAAKSMHRTLGEVLVDLELVRAEDLNFILRKYDKQLKLGEILIKQQVISERDFQAAIQEQGQTNTALGQVLLGKELVTIDQLFEALSRQYNIPYRDLADFSYAGTEKSALTRVVGEKFSLRNRLLPLSLDRETLTIGITHPKSLAALQDIKPMYGERNISTVFINDGKFAELFTLLYGRTLPGADGVEMPMSVDGGDLVEIDLDQTKGEAGANLYGGTDLMAEQVVDHIIKYGIINGASDIHLEQDREKTTLRYRLDGVCEEHNPAWLDEKLQAMPGAIISRIKVMSNLDIAERRLPQDGVFRINYLDRGSKKRFDLDFRVATCPAISGENVTIRILDSRKAKVGLENLNHSEEVLSPLKRLFKSSAGMVLVSGPTGSGKSSTLYGALQYIYHPGIKIITAEDPIEYSFPGIMQTQVKPKIGLTFARLLRSFLRLDPDVILVGEIRDPETAAIGFDAAQTGHLLLSTIHTNDAVSAVSRLLDLAIEPNQIAASLIGVLAQRLVRRNCLKCAREYRPARAEWRLFFRNYPDHLRFHRGIGCKACGFSGYSGRTVISELFEINRDIALAMSAGASERQLKQIALETGMRTMIDDGLRKLDQTTLSEILRVVPIEMVKEFSQRSALRPADAGDDFASPDATLLIADPEDDWPLIDKLYETYRRLSEEVGQSLNKGDADLFRKFIREHFGAIQRAHRCNRIEFILQKRADAVEIAARPQWGGA